MQTTNNDSNDKKTVVLLDRSIVQVLPPRVQTSGISPPVERLHQLQGSSLIFCVCNMMKLPTTTYATACTIFHRFYYQRTLQEYSVWNIAMGSTLLATKLSSEPNRPSLKTIVLYFGRVYQSRKQQQKQQSTTNYQAMSTLGPVWKEWKQAILDAEAVILRQLGFTLYWIPDSHPHKWLRPLLEELELDDDSKLAQRAWNYCNDSHRFDFCVRYEPAVVACAAIYLACQDHSIGLPPKWYTVLSRATDEDLGTIANALLGLNEEKDFQLASTGFCPSLVPGGSFNDPGSFLWEYGQNTKLTTATNGHG